jgi:hypothetical protein
MKLYYLVCSLIFAYSFAIIASQESEAFKDLKRKQQNLVSSIFPNGQFICSIQKLEERVGKSFFDQLTNKEKISLLECCAMAKVVGPMIDSRIDLQVAAAQVSDAELKEGKKFLAELEDRAEQTVGELEKSLK